MVGAVPRVEAHTRAVRMTSSGVRRHARWIGICLLLPLSLTLAQCGNAPNPAALAANSRANVPANVQVIAKTNDKNNARINPQAASDDTFEDRFPAPPFRDRF